MRNTNKRKNVLSTLFKVISLCVILTCVFLLASCDQSSDHKCLFGGQKLTASSGTELSSKISTLSPGIYYYYLSANISVTETIKVPEGVFVGICRAGVYDITVQDSVDFFEVVDKDIEGTEGYGTVDAGGIYVYNCGTHAIHAGKTYYKVEQSMLDLFADSGTSIYSKFAVDQQLNLALMSDVVIDDEFFMVPNGYTLRICLNSPDSSDNPDEIYTLTIADGIDLTKDGGDLVVINCLSSTYHECIHLDNNNVLAIDGQNSASVEKIFAKISALESGDIFYGYLVNDIEWQDELSVKEGATVMICLNGFSANGQIKNGEVTETVTDENGETSKVVNTYGNILIFDCSNHICQDVCEQGNMLALNNSSVDWIYSALKQIQKQSDSLIPIYCVLEQDVELEILEGYELRVCLNGFKDRKSVTKTETVDGVETVVGSISYYNCASMAVNKYHSCSFINTLTMGTMQTNSIDATSAEDLNVLFSLFESGDPYMLNLTGDVVGGGTVTVPDGVMVTICLNGYTMDDITFDTTDQSLVFVYQCNNVYCVEAGKEIPAFDQNIIDFLGMISGGESMGFDYDMQIAAAEDIKVPETLIDMGDGYVFSICTCGHSVTGLEDNEGVVLHDGCQNYVAPDTDDGIEEVPVLSIPHSEVCFIPSFIGLKPIALGDKTLDEVNSVLGAITEEQGGAFYYLTSDLEGEGELTLSDNVIAGICLNGFTISDDITLGEGVFVYECKQQYCAQIDETIYSLDQEIFDFFITLYNMDPPEDTTAPLFVLESDFTFAMSEDIVLPDNMFGFNDGVKLRICTCGNQISCNDDLVASGNIVLHSGCSAGMLSCEVCDRIKSQPLNYDTLSNMIDKDGRVILPSGSYYYYLENDFQLTRTLTIPSGVDLHICLHGYNLYSAYIWCDSKTFGYGYPESASTSVTIVEEGGIFNIYDCSEGMTGELSLKFFRKDRDGDGLKEIVLNISEDNQGFEGLGEGIGAALSTFVANIAINSGTINIYGGNFNSMIGFINQGNGVINIYRGRVNATYMGILQASVSSESTEASNSSVYIGEGTTLSAGLVGVYGMGGNVTLDGGTINAGLAGIAMTSSDSDAESSIILNGGSINLAESSQMMDTMVGTWVAVGGNATEIDVSSMLESTEEIIAVSTDDNITINGDVDITMGNLTENSGVQSSDMYFTESTNVTVSENVTNNYTLNVDGTTTVGENDIFTPSEDCMKIVNSDGEIVVMPVPSNGVYASVEAMSASTKGEITLNLYAKANAELKDRILFYVQHKNSAEPVEYKLSEADVVSVSGVDMYRFAIPTSAKDYASEITYYFVLLPAADGTTDSYSDFVNAKMGTNSVSVNEYLDKLIEKADTYGTKAAELAQSMKNYCSAAAKHFDVSDAYEIPAELESNMSSVTVDGVKEYAPSRDCAEDSKAIFKTVTVMLKSTTSIRVYFALAEGCDLDDIDVAVAFDNMDDSANYIDIRVVESGIETRPYYVEMSGIYAKDLNKTFSVTIDKLTVNYSVMSYVYSVLNNPSKYGEDVVNVVKALVIYNEKAIAYFNCEHIFDNACDDRCNGCGYLRAVEGHVNADPVIENYVAPSCVNGSYEEVVYCSVCNIEISRYYYYPSPVHTEGESVEIDRVESTCTSQGYYTTVIYCSTCSTDDNKIEISRTTTSLPLASHTWGESDANGKITCSVCNKTCSATGHTEVVEAAKAPDCTTDGSTEYKYCSECGEILVAQTVQPALGHTPSEPKIQNNVEATCTADGGYDTVVSCTVCKTELSRVHTVVPAIAHTSGDAVQENIVEFPTCTVSAGYDNVVSCTVCKTELSREHIVTEAALEHTPGTETIDNVVNADCTVDGRYDTVVYCEVCTTELSRVCTVNDVAVGHTEGEPKTENNVDPTCTNEGSYDTVVCCTVCSTELSRENIAVPVIEHTSGESAVENIIAPTCTEDGSCDHVTYCKVCNVELSRESVVLSSNGHTYADGYCTACGEPEADEGGAE